MNVNMRQRSRRLVWSAMVLVGLLAFPSAARANDCGDLADCLATNEAAALIVAGLALAAAAAPYVVGGVAVRLGARPVLQVGGTWTEKSRIAAAFASPLGRLLGRAGHRGLGRTIGFPEKQIQKKFKHSPDFGVIGHFSNANAARLERAIIAHVKDRATVPIEGVYREKPATHFFNQKTRLNVVRNPDGTFRSGWKMNAQQVRYLLELKKLGGE